MSPEAFDSQMQDEDGIEKDGYDAFPEVPREDCPYPRRSWQGVAWRCGYDDAMRDADRMALEDSLAAARSSLVKGAQ